MLDSMQESTLMPRGYAANTPPERACVLMAEELAALEQDIVTARATARRVAAGGMQLGSRRPKHPPTGEWVQLPAGFSVAIRPIGPQDAHTVTQSFHRLGALSRFHRFLSPIDRLTPEQVTYLTHVDHVAHEAFVAFDVNGEGLGEARYLRDPKTPHEAWFAVAVVDAWQGRGLGHALLERLGARAHANGIEALTGSTVAGNIAVRRLLEGSVGRLAENPRTGTLQVTAMLDEVSLAAPWRRTQPALAY